MARKPNSSRQTEALLAAFLEQPQEWKHGYDLSRGVGLQSGTLYPILMRLRGQGWLESKWEERPVPGRPPRHFYRLTPLGLESARVQFAEKRTAATTAGIALREARS